MKLPLFEIGAVVVLWAMPVLAATEPTDLVDTPPGAQPRLEFQLPLPGEAIPAEGGGVLVQVDSTIDQVLFKWFGPDSGSAEGKVQFEGFFQAQVGPLKPGRWTLVAMGFDPQGHMNARRSVNFDVGEVAGSSRQIPSQARVQQDLYLSANSGLNLGTAENPLRSYRSLELGPDGRSVPGRKMEPLDRVFSGNAALVYHLQQGSFRLKTRLSTDASETWSHTQSPSRFGADLYWNDWAEAHLGDQYPDWSPMLMDGTRLRGGGIGLAARADETGMARIDFAIGFLRPAVDPQIRTWDNLVDTMPAQFARRIEAAHLGLEAHGASLNFTVFHSRDEIGEVDLRLHDSLNGPAPRENTGVAADFLARFLNRRLEAYWNSALALTTDDTREGNFIDSLRKAQDLPLPTFLTDVLSANLSTRGVELLTQKSPRVDEFVWENASIRTGARLLIPLGSLGRLRLDSRWVHVGSYFQSFAKTFQENARTGLEWSATTATVHDALLLVVSGSEVESHPAMGIDLPTHSINATLAWTPVAAPIGWNLQSGSLASGGGAAFNRSESWNAGAGLFGTLHTPDRSPLFWRTNYGYYENAVRIPISSFDTSSTIPVDSQFTTRSYRSLVQTHTFDASLRWRPTRDLEGRTGYLLASQGVPTDTLVANQTQTHRFQAGLTVWGLSRQLEVALDGSYVLRPDQPEPNAEGWDQSLRTSWEFASSQTLRFLEHWGHLSGDRYDLRLEVGWEAWF
jgi:hypothetical protein